VHTFDSRSPRKRDQAQKWVAQALERRQGVISYQVMQEFLSVALRKFANPLSAAEAVLYLHRVLMPLCKVFPSEALFADALSVADDTGWSWYDSLIVSSAAADYSVLASEDLQSGRMVRGVRIQNPFVDSPEP
jgi:predicted nucleic acid-binding protein